jgi:hypothetical protein
VLGRKLCNSVPRCVRTCGCPNWNTVQPPGEITAKPAPFLCNTFARFALLHAGLAASFTSTKYT